MPCLLDLSGTPWRLLMRGYCPLGIALALGIGVYQTPANGADKAAKAPATSPAKSSGQAIPARPSRAAAKPSASKAPATRPAADPVAAFLAQLEAASSLREVEKARARARFNTAQKQRLERALKMPRYQRVLERLHKQAGTRSPAASTTPGIATGAAPAVRDARRGLARDRGAASPAGGQVPRSATAGAPPVISSAAGTMAAPSVVGEPIAYIDTLEPQPVSVGARLTIHGRQFTEQRGQVDLIFEDTNTRVPLDIESWSPRRIRVTVSPLIGDLIGESGRSALLWVKIANSGGQGPTDTVTLIPDPATLIPRITVVSTDQVMPGEPFTIAGDNFLESRPGHIDLVFGSLRYRALMSPDGWHNQTVRAWLAADIVAAAPLEGHLELTNHAGNRATHPIRFTPRLETVELFASLRGDYCVGYDMHETWTRHADANPLRNGWKVKAYSLQADPGSSYYADRCEEVRAPVIGSNNPTHSFIQHCYPDENITCESRVIIEGPQGLPFE